MTLPNKKNKPRKGLKRGGPIERKTPFRARWRGSKKKPTGKALSRKGELIPPHSEIVGKLDELTSQILRAVYHRCVTCGKIYNLQCSHVFGRVVVATRFDLHPGGNCVVQCERCNQSHPLRPQVLLGWFVREFGLTKLSALKKRWQRPKKIEDWILAEKIPVYTRLLAELKAKEGSFEERLSLLKLWILREGLCER